MKSDSPGGFLGGRIGIDLDVVVIAHNPEVQRLMDEHRLEWGVQWELARGVSTKLWSWSDIKDKLTQLQGSNSKVAYKVPGIVLNKPSQSLADLSIWYFSIPFSRSSNLTPFEGVN